LEHFEAAAFAFTVCTALAPQNASCFHNRALAFAGMKRNDQAMQDFERVLQLDPHQVQAAELIQKLWNQP
jgi:lipoprotein NlpI